MRSNPQLKHLKLELFTTSNWIVDFTEYLQNIEILEVCGTFIPTQHHSNLHKIHLKNVKHSTVTLRGTLPGHAIALNMFIFDRLESLTLFVEEKDLQHDLQSLELFSAKHSSIRKLEFHTMAYGDSFELVFGHVVQFNLWVKKSLPLLEEIQYFIFIRRIRDRPHFLHQAVTNIVSDSNDAIKTVYFFFELPLEHTKYFSKNINDGWSMSLAQNRKCVTFERRN